MTLWAVGYHCGDYYCEDAHVLGIYETQELAEAVIETQKVSDCHKYYEYKAFPFTLNEDW